MRKSVIPEPNAEQLAAIALNAADYAGTFNLEPRVAMLSFSNFGSVKHDQASKMQAATRIVKEARPDLQIDGEMQADTALRGDILETQYPFNRLGAPANVLIFPDLNSANIAYKLFMRLGEVDAVGPILVGLENPAAGILAGAVFTAVVQSSAATVGIAIAMASEGLLALPAGIALALGANIGTAVTTAT